MHQRAIPNLSPKIRPTPVANVFGLWHQEIVKEHTSKQNYKGERTNILKVMNKKTKKLSNLRVCSFV